MRRFCIIALTVLVSTAACSQAPAGDAPPTVSDDQRLQKKFETARQAASRMRARRAAGHDIYADCKTIEMLLVGDLQRLKRPTVARLLAELATLCRHAKPFR